MTIGRVRGDPERPAARARRRYDPGPMSDDHRRVVSSARLIGMATLLSRITGMVRDMELARAYGAGWVSDAFWYAFAFPNLFRRLFAEGAMSSVFVPVFSVTLQREGRPAAWSLLARTTALLAAALLVVTLLVELVILGAWWVGVSRATALDADLLAARRLLLSLTALMFPFLFTISLLSLFSSILNCLGSFGPAALMPLVTNVVMLCGLWFLDPLFSADDPSRRVYGVSISVLLAGAAQLLLLWPVLRARGVPVAWRWEPRDATVRRMLALLGPVVLGQGVLMVGVLIDQQVCALFSHVAGAPRSTSWLGVQFAYPLREGALTVLNNAQRLYQFPLGVLGISLAVAALPAFTRLAADERWHEWTRHVRASTRLAIFGGLLTGAMLVLLGEAIVALLFQRGQFTPDATRRAARVLAAYGLGMWAFCAQHIVLRGFYSLTDVRTPLRLSCFVLPLNVALSLILIWVPAVREAAFGLSTALTTSINVLWGMHILARRAGEPLMDRAALTAVARMLAATAVAVAAVWAYRATGLATGAEAARLTARLLDVFGSLAIGTGVFLGVSALLGLGECRMVLARGRRSPAGDGPGE